jgi:hypothetical protein
MFQINIAELADGEGAINYPMEQGTKRRYTLSLESSGYSSNMVAGKVFQSLSANSVEFRNSSTVALTFQLPMPLQSRSGFFNVSLRSMAVGQNTTNTLHDPLGAGSDVSYTPLNSNLTVNLANASSAYNLQIKDNDKEFVSLKYLDANDNFITVTSKSSDPQSITRMEQLAGPVCPIGTCQINRTGSDIHVTSTGAGASEHSMNAPFNYSTRCDDYVATIPDSTFQSGSITVVLTSCADVWVNSPVKPPTDPPTSDLSKVLRTNVPLMVNSTEGEAAGVVTIAYAQYLPFNLPYTLVLSLEEA